VIKELSHLPIIVDPSHAPENAALFLRFRAALAAGADGIMVEVHG
jgi:3-deoxy-7-phosphoheptulonate synthase